MMRIGFDRPRGARGLLPLILGAYAVGKGIYSAINANQVKQRNKGYIEDAYRGAVQRQGVHETDVRQGTAESLNARGLMTPGAQFSQTAPSLTQSAYAGGQPSTLGGQMEADTNRELGLERHDLDAAHSRALNENKADYLNSLVGAASNTAQGVMQAYGAGKTLGAMNDMGGAAPSAPSASVAAPAPRLIDSVAPGTQMHPETGEVVGALGYHPNSAMPQTLSAYGQSNADFHVG